ncbi:MAG: hypothetical protein J6S40_02245 [Thermoguttaceae bacterium]|nr:hypothetical protein [Thermoguttaceae bacterium]
MFGVLKKRGFLRFAAAFSLTAAALFTASASVLFADGFYSEQFSLTAPGDPPIELAASSASIDSLTEFVTSDEVSPFDVETSDRCAAGGCGVFDDIDFASLALSDSLMILGQDYGYWSAVQSSPIFVAQTTSGLSAADQAPTLGTVGSVPQSTTTIAPPLDAATLTPSSGTIAPPAPIDSNPDFFSQPVQTMKRFWEGTSAHYTFIPKRGSVGLGLHDFDFNMQFNFPCRCLPHSTKDGASGYWYFSPNFGLQLWNMPDVPVHAMPNQTFDASLGFGCAPQFTDDFGADLWIQLGVASSFKKIDKHAFFIRGRGLATVRINEYITALGGVTYYGRNRFKLLPSGGIRWVPNEKNDWYIVFPNPRLSHYIANMNETKWWGYLQGDIGGGRWLTKDYDGTYNVDYNDYRVGLGLQFECPSGFKGEFEVGGAFGRQLYAHKHAYYKPKSSVYLQAGFAF